MLASYLCNPHDHHMDAALHLYSYLKSKHNTCLVLDPSYPEINHDDFIKRD